MTLTPTTLNETLDTRGLLDAAHGPGTYALRVETPDGVEGIARAFLDVCGATPPDGTMQQLTAQRVAYVGASSDVYSRLMDHAESDVRQALFLRAFTPTDVVGVWPASDPFAAEFNRAVALSQDGWTCWQDGEVI